MNRKELTQRHWRYYLILEKRFMESIEYVELHKNNFNTFSDGYALLIQAIGAELDVVFKEFCGFNKSERKIISDYAQSIWASHPDIVNQKIVLRDFDLKIQPFRDWDPCKAAQSLTWWTAFTAIKHNRYDKREEAKQENVVNILGALYLLENMYLKAITLNSNELDLFDEDSKLFTLENWPVKAIRMREAFGMTSAK